jgi:hypothetical protein
MCSTYDYLMNKFRNLFYKDDDKLITTHYNLSFICKNTIIDINDLYKKLIPIENFVDNIDLCKLSIFNDYKILQSYTEKYQNIEENYIILYFVNKITNTKINIKILQDIVDINISNRNQINIDYHDIINIMIKIIDLSKINVLNIVDININRIQSYFLTNINLISDKFYNFLIKNNINCDKSFDIKYINIKSNNKNIYIFNNSILINCDTYNDMIDVYDYMNILIDEYNIELDIISEETYKSYNILYFVTETCI